MNKENVLNEIACRSGEVRDAHVANLPVFKVLAGKKVFTVMGASHVVMPESALRARLATSLADDSPQQKRLSSR